MDLITIYQDNNLQVEIESIALLYLEAIANSQLKLSPYEASLILELLLEKVNQKFDLKDKKVITTQTIPILNRKEIFDLNDVYCALEDAVLLLSEAFDLTKGQLDNEWKYQISNYISSHYYLTYRKKCDIIFLDEKVHRVSAAIVILDGDRLLLLPLSINEDDFYQRLG